MVELRAGSAERRRRGQGRLLRPFYLHKAIETVTKNRELVEKFARIAEAGYSVGKGVQQDVLKAQVEISKLIDQLTVLEQRRQTAEARINSLLYREPETPVGRPEEIRPREFTHSLAELNEAALTNYPALRSGARLTASNMALNSPGKTSIPTSPSV